jgi:hypothetical protein
MSLLFEEVLISVTHAGFRVEADDRGTALEIQFNTIDSLVDWLRLNLKTPDGKTSKLSKTKTRKD